MHRPWRVLLADDDGDLRHICGEYFKELGYAVTHASNGAEALAMAASRKPDAIVIDLDMPVMGGLEAIARLRRDPGTRALPIVVLSASSTVDHARAATAGSDTCLRKPCGLDVLERTVRALIESQHPEVTDRDSSIG